MKIYNEKSDEIDEIIDNINVDNMNDDILIENDINKNKSINNDDLEKKNIGYIDNKIDQLQIDNINKPEEITSPDTCNNVLFIKNISFESTEKDLKELFIKYDKHLKSVKLISNKNFTNNTHLGYGFVECSNVESAIRIISNCNLVEVHSHQIQVSLSNKKEESVDLKRKRQGKEGDV